MFTYKHAVVKVNHPPKTIMKSYYNEPPALRASWNASEPLDQNRKNKKVKRNMKLYSKVNPLQTPVSKSENRDKSCCKFNLDMAKELKESLNTDLDIILPESGILGKYIFNSQIKPVFIEVLEKTIEVFNDEDKLKEKDTPIDSIPTRLAKKLEKRFGTVTEADYKSTFKAAGQFLVFVIGFCLIWHLFNDYRDSTTEDGSDYDHLKVLKKKHYYLFKWLSFSVIALTALAMIYPDELGITRILKLLNSIVTKLEKPDSILPEDGFNAAEFTDIIGSFVPLILGTNMFFKKHVSCEDVVIKLNRMWTARKTVSEVSTFLVGLVEKLYNLLENKYGSGNEVRLLSTSLENVEKCIQSARELLAVEKQGKFFRNSGNAAILNGRLRELRLLIRNSRPDLKIEISRALDPYINALRSLVHVFDAANLSNIGLRPEPVVTMFHGGPGTFKSISMHALSIAVAARTVPVTFVKDLRSSPNQFIYNRNIKDDFWDGYANQWVTQVDEVGQNKPAQLQPNNEFSEIITMNNTAPMPLHSASLEDKGTMFFHSQFVNCTSNLSEFKPDCLASSEAFTRRLDFKWIVVPKEHLRMSSRKQLKTKFKVNTERFTEVFDFWHTKLDLEKVDRVTRHVEINGDEVDQEVTDVHVGLFDYYKSDENGKAYGAAHSFEEIVELTIDMYKLKHSYFAGIRDRTEMLLDKYINPRIEDKEIVEKIDLDMETIFPESNFSDVEANIHRQPHDSILGSMSYHGTGSDPQSTWGEQLSVDSKFSWSGPKDSEPPWDVLDDSGTGTAGLDELIFELGMSYDEGVSYLSQDKLMNFNMPYADFVLGWHGIEDEQFLNLGTWKFFLMDGDAPFVARLIKHYFDNGDSQPLRTWLLKYFNSHLDILQWYKPTSLEKFEIKHDGIIANLRNAFGLMLDVAKEAVSIVWQEIKNSDFFLIFYKWKGTIMTITGLLSIPLLWTGLQKLFFGDTVPESFNFSDKSFRNKVSGPRFKAKSMIKNLKSNSQPQNGGQIDSNGQDIAMSIVKSNLWFMSVQKEDVPDAFTTMGHILVVKGRIAIVPYHFISKIVDAIDHTLWNTLKIRLRKTSCATVYFTIEDFMKGVSIDFLPNDDDDMEGDTRFNSVNNDWITAKLPLPMQPGRDITKFFVSSKNHEFIKQNIPFIMPSMNGDTLMTHSSHAKAFRDVTVTPDTKDRSQDYVIRRSYTYQNMTKSGDCGAPLFIMNPQMGVEKIFGIHAAASRGNGLSFAGSICYEDLMAQVNTYQDEPHMINLPECGNFPNECFMDGRFNVLGKTSMAPSANLSTEIRKSSIYGCFPEDKPISKPVHLKAFHTKSESGELILIDPWVTSNQKFGLPPPILDKNIIERIQRSYLSFLLQVSNVRLNVRPITNSESLFGIDTCDSFNSLKSSTSAGYPMNVSGQRNMKKELFSDVSLSVSQREKLPVYKEICDEIATIEAEMQRGEIRAFVYTDNGKDERMEISKVEKGKLRKFSGISFFHLVMFRKYFGMFMMFIMENRIANGIAVGVNPYSDEWTTIVRVLQNDEEAADVDAGDFSAFDGSQNVDLVMAIFWIVDNWYRLYETDSEYLYNHKMRYGIWCNKANSIHITKGIIFEILGNESSGNYGTATFNSLYNSLCFRYVAEYERPGINFNNVFRLMKCGDDVIYSVLKAYKDVFNGMTMPALMKVVGMTYTSETKEATVVPWRKITEVEFLKRSFVYDRTENRWIAPMRLKDVLEICQWTRKGDRLTKTADNVDATLGELSLHKRSVYEKYQSLIFRAVEQVPSHLALSDRCHLSWKDRRDEVLQTGFAYTM